MKPKKPPTAHKRIGKAGHNRPAPFLLTPRLGDPGFEQAWKAAGKYYREILPAVTAALMAVKGRVTDDEQTGWAAENLAGVIARERFIQPGGWFLPQPPREMARQMTALADALEVYREAAHGFGMHASEMVWPVRRPISNDGRKWRLGDDPLVHQVVHGLPPKLPSIIQHLRGKAREVSSIKSTARGRPREKVGRAIASQAAYTYLEITRKFPGQSPEGSPGPFARLLSQIFEIAEIHASYIELANEAAAKSSGKNHR